VGREARGRGNAQQPLAGNQAEPSTFVPAQSVAGQESPMRLNTPVASVGLSLPVPAAKSPA